MMSPWDRVLEKDIGASDIRIHGSPGARGTDREILGAVMVVIQRGKRGAETATLVSFARELEHTFLGIEGSALEERAVLENADRPPAIRGARGGNGQIVFAIVREIGKNQ